jgi:hypothetical protein
MTRIQAVLMASSLAVCLGSAGPAGAAPQAKPGLDHRPAGGLDHRPAARTGSDLTPGSRPAPPIIEAARRADLPQIRKIIQGRPGAVNAQDTSVGGQKWTALHWLIWLARPGSPSAAVRLLLASGARVDCRDELGLTPLHLAAWRGRLELAALLLQKGATVNAVSKPGRITPLHCAAWAGHHQVVALLLQKGGRVDSRDVNGWTPLHGAAFEGHDRVVAVLLAKGARVNATDGRGRTPLYWAKIRRFNDVAGQLMRKGGR